MPFFGGFRSKGQHNYSPTRSMIHTQKCDKDSDSKNSAESRLSNSFRRLFRSHHESISPDLYSNNRKSHPVVRSDTFTKEKESEKEDSKRTRPIFNTITRKKGNGVKTDVFEVLYQKPGSTTKSRASPARSDFDSRTYRKPKLFERYREKESSLNEDERLFYNPTISSRVDLNDSIKNEKDYEDHMSPDKYKTYSKKSFRPDYVDPEDNRALVWFVDVDKPAKSRPSRAVVRTETFKVEQKPVITIRSNSETVESPERITSHNIISRKSMNEPIRVEITQSDSSVKVVPVGVATPYNSIRNEYSPQPRSAPIRSTLYSGPRVEPIKIVIDRNSIQNRNNLNTNSPVNRHKSSDKRLTTTIMLPDNTNSSFRAVKNSSQSQPSSFAQRSTFQDVFNAARTPGGYRSTTSIVDKDSRVGLKPNRFVSTLKGVVIKEVIDGTPCENCKDLCPGFEAHSWRKTCQACKCPRENHAVYHQQLTSVRERLGFKPELHTSKIDPRQLGYTWVPPGLLTSSKVQKYFDGIPQDKVPKIGSTGEGNRNKQLSYQLPKQDLALNYCKHIESHNRSSYEDFVAARNEIALDIAYVKDAPGSSKCTNCKEQLSHGELAVIAPKFREHTLWHPRCFSCTTCDELLVDLTYCVFNDKIYCERHYAEMLKPRCNACDELIFSGEYTKAMSKDWHNGHFCCWHCDDSLTGQRYVLRDDHPYCIKCYEEVFANTCKECNKIIGIDSKDLSYKDKHWHEACFLCSKCRMSLVDKQFGSKAEKIYCGNCYDTQFASRCDGCGEVFRAGTKKMEYKTRQWHEKCFCCCVCKTPIGTKSFIPREQEIFCAGCYEEKFATRCIKCNKIITSGGVTYKNEPWHRDCFTCTHCQTSLAGQRFTSRDDKPYCAECFGELFAKRCTSCTKPITGIGGTRFISFEDRHWHNDCFICAMCKTSLVGRGFITDAADIICPECAKQKLM